MDTCRECGQPQTTRFLSWDRPHKCQPLSREAIIYRQRKAYELIAELNAPGSKMQAVGLVGIAKSDAEIWRDMKL